MSDTYTQVDTQQSNAETSSLQSANMQVKNLLNNAQNNSVGNATNKQKLFKVKEGQILRYKKRLFSNNWRPAQLTLYSNGTFMIQSRRISSPALIKCEKHSTLIIFGQQLDFIPKRPIPPNYHKLEHMLAIGLINHAFTSQGRLKGTQIIFYWFSLGSQEELINWVVAFQNSLYSNSLQTVKTPLDFQTVTNNIALNNTRNIANLDHTINGSTKNPNDDISMSCLMANTALNASGIGTGTGLAAVGAAGLLAANTQYQALFDNQNLGANSFVLDAMSGRSNKILNPLAATNGYLGDDATVYMIDPLNIQLNSGVEGGTSYISNVQGSNGNFQSNNAVPIAEMATIMNAADFMNCSAVDCSVDCSADAGGDCSFDGGMGDLAFAFL